MLHPTAANTPSDVPRSVGMAAPKQTSSFPTMSDAVYEARGNHRTLHERVRITSHREESFVGQTGTIIDVPSGTNRSWYTLTLDSGEVVRTRGKCLVPLDEAGDGNNEPGESVMSATVLDDGDTILVDVGVPKARAAQPPQPLQGDTPVSVNKPSPSIAARTSPASEETDTTKRGGHDSDVEEEGDDVEDDDSDGPMNEGPLRETSEQEKLKNAMSDAEIARACASETKVSGHAVTVLEGMPAGTCVRITTGDHIGDLAVLVETYYDAEARRLAYVSFLHGGEAATQRRVHVHSSRIHRKPFSYDEIEVVSPAQNILLDDTDSLKHTLRRFHRSIHKQLSVAQRTQRNLQFSNPGRQWADTRSARSKRAYVDSLHGESQSDQPKAKRSKTKKAPKAAKGGSNTPKASDQKPKSSPTTHKVKRRDVLKWIEDLPHESLVGDAMVTSASLTIRVTAAIKGNLRAFRIFYQTYGPIVYHNFGPSLAEAETMRTIWKHLSHATTMHFARFVNDVAGLVAPADRHRRA